MAVENTRTARYQPSAAHPIKRRRLSDEILAEFERLIVSGIYAPGDLLPSERELMERFGVGRPAIREALFSLQKNGLVALTSGARARVTEPSADRVISELTGAARYFLSTEEGERAFQDARMFFEVGLARNAAASATKEDITRLQKALRANENAIGDIEEFQRTDVAFHAELALISRNPIFKAIHDAIEAWLLQQRRVSLMIPGALSEAHGYHRKIFEAIAAHQPDRAGEAMRDHLRSVAKYYWRARQGHS
ncbi:MAG TPA: transcriptional regulator NanR [Alphaproteobacteria bacterium]|nr:transcriptional regulator NanR [Alphaproteobacteria bacterium]